MALQPIRVLPIKVLEIKKSKKISASTVYFQAIEKWYSAFHCDTLSNNQRRNPTSGGRYMAAKVKFSWTIFSLWTGFAVLVALVIGISMYMEPLPNQMESGSSAEETRNLTIVLVWSIVFCCWLVGVVLQSFYHLMQRLSGNSISKRGQ